MVSSIVSSRFGEGFRQPSNREDIVYLSRGQLGLVVATSITCLNDRSALSNMCPPAAYRRSSGQPTTQAVSHTFCWSVSLVHPKRTPPMFASAARSTNAPAAGATFSSNLPTPSSPLLLPLTRATRWCIDKAHRKTLGCETGQPCPVNGSRNFVHMSRNLVPVEKSRYVLVRRFLGR